MSFNCFNTLFICSSLLWLATTYVKILKITFHGTFVERIIFYNNRLFDLQRPPDKQ